MCVSVCVAESVGGWVYLRWGQVGYWEGTAHAGGGGNKFLQNFGRFLGNKSLTLQNSLLHSLTLQKKRPVNWDRSLRARVLSIGNLVDRKISVNCEL